MKYTNPDDFALQNLSNQIILEVTPGFIQDKLEKAPEYASPHAIKQRTRIKSALIDKLFADQNSFVVRSLQETGIQHNADIDSQPRFLCHVNGKQQTNLYRLTVCQIADTEQGREAITYPEGIFFKFQKKSNVDIAVLFGSSEQDVTTEVSFETRADAAKFVKSLAVHTGTQIPIKQLDILQ